MTRVFMARPSSPEHLHAAATTIVRARGILHCPNKRSCIALHVEPMRFQFFLNGKIIKTQHANEQATHPTKSENQTPQLGDCCPRACVRVRICVYAQPCAHVNNPITDFNSVSDPITEPITDFDQCWRLTISSSCWARPAPSKQSPHRCLLMRVRSK